MTRVDDGAPRPCRTVLVETACGHNRRTVVPADAPEKVGHGEWVVADADDFVAARA